METHPRTARWAAIGAIVLAAALLGGPLPAAAQFGHGGHGGGHGGVGGHGGGFGGHGGFHGGHGDFGHGGFGFGSGSPAFGYGYPGYGYYGDSCYLVRRRVVDRYGRVYFRRVEVCS